MPNVFYTEFSLVAHEDNTLTVKNVHSAPESLIDLQKFQEDIDTSVGVFTIMSSEAKTKTGKLTLASATSFHFHDTPLNVLH